MLTEKQKLQIALADLFLDTDVEQFHANIRTTMDEVSLTNEEVKNILFNEIAPALAFNMLDTTGEWAGYDETWLFERIQKMKNRPIASLFYKIISRSYTKSQWFELTKTNKN